MAELEAIVAQLENLVADDRSRSLLVERWEAARVAMPALGCSLERFLRAWDRMVGKPTPLAAALATASFDDLVLAIACGEGDEAALALFEHRFLAQIPIYLGRNGGTPEFADEVRQKVRLRLFVAEPGVQPKIASYAGTGPLGAWLRVVTIRIARDLHRAARPEAPLDEAIGVRSAKPDPELDYLKMRYGEEFRAAVVEVLRGLEPRERNLLKLYLLDAAHGRGDRRDVQRQPFDDHAPPRGHPPAHPRRNASPARRTARHR